MNEFTPKKSKKIKKKRSQKTSWYEVLYPTYKSRCIDFKRIFTDVIPSNDRLIADYACALQREILVQGRLYASLNYICFYANLFRWETLVYIKWEDVRAISREKTVFVIPNAIQIHTENEKYFLTSFISRDKTYGMLFKLWQNALSDQPFSHSDVLSLVQLCYGTDLGYSSDDEELVAMEEKITRPTSEASDQPNLPKITIDEDEIRVKIISPVAADIESNKSQEDPIICPVPHEGRMILKIDLNVDVEKLFNLIFTESEFFVNFQKSRKNTDLKFSPWILNSDSKQKTRIFQLTVPLNQALGPKSCNVKETQVLSKLSQPGKLYIIDVESANSGVPYADTFHVAFHYCLLKTSPKTSSLSVHSRIVYRKSVWGLIKNFIEKNVWSGVEDSFKHLSRALDEYCRNLKQPNEEESNVETPTSISEQVVDDVTENLKVCDHDIPEIVRENLILPQHNASFSSENKISFRAIIFCLLMCLATINVALFYQYNTLERNFHLHEKFDNRLTKKYCDRSFDGSELTYCTKSSLSDWHDLVHSLSILQQAENNLRRAKVKLLELIQRNSKTTPLTHINPDKNYSS